MACDVLPVAMFLVSFLWFNVLQFLCFPPVFPLAFYFLFGRDIRPQPGNFSQKNPSNEPGVQWNKINIYEFSGRDRSSKTSSQHPYTFLMNHILLLETPCPSVHWSVRILQFLPHLTRTLTMRTLTMRTLTLTLTTSLRGSHGLSVRRARRTKYSRPEGPPTRSWGQEGP